MYVYIGLHTCIHIYVMLYVQDLGTVDNVLNDIKSTDGRCRLSKNQPSKLYLAYNCAHH